MEKTYDVIVSGGGVAGCAAALAARRAGKTVLLIEKTLALGGLGTLLITSIRMKEAKRILEGDPDILINDLAVRVGFNTPKYFSKCFKKEFGIFPKEFAEQMQSKG